MDELRPSDIPHLFRCVMKYLFDLKDQTAVASTCKKYNQWAYSCNMWSHTTSVHIKKAIRIACQMERDNLRALPRDKNINKKIVDLMRREIPLDSYHRMDEQSTLLGRTFFEKVSTDITKRHGQYVLRAIENGKISDNLFRVLSQIPEAIAFIDRNIAIYESYRELIDCHKRGKLNEFLEKYREEIIEEYKFEQQLNDDIYIEEPSDPPADDILFKFLTDLAEYYESPPIKAGEARLVEFKALLTAPLPNLR